MANFTEFSRWMENKIWIYRNGVNSWGGLSKMAKGQGLSKKAVIKSVMDDLKSLNEKFDKEEAFKIIFCRLKRHEDWDATYG